MTLTPTQACPESGCLGQMTGTHAHIERDTDGIMIVEFSPYWIADYSCGHHFPEWHFIDAGGNR